MPMIEQTPLIRLSNLFPEQEVHAKCEFLAASGCFKIRGALHLLGRLREQDSKPPLVVPSMGNTALGAAVAAREHGFAMVGVVPRTIARAKDGKLQALGVELIKIDGGGSDLLRRATEIARERDGYFVHPHLDPAWTDGYQAIAREILEQLPGCRSLVFPLGGGGLLMGLCKALRSHQPRLHLIGCEPFNYPKYAMFQHARTRSIADGLLLEHPHPSVQEEIRRLNIDVRLIEEDAIRGAMRDLLSKQALRVEPSSAIALACVLQHARDIAQPCCVILTGENIAREDFDRLVAP